MLHLNLPPTSWVPPLSGGSFLLCNTQLLIRVDFERTALLMFVKVYWLIPGVEQVLGKNPFYIPFSPSLPSHRSLLLSKHQYPSIINWEAISQVGWRVKTQMYMKGPASKQAVNTRRLLSHGRLGAPSQSAEILRILRVRPAVAPALFRFAKMTQEKKAQRMTCWKKRQLTS